MAERTNPHANLIIGAQDEASPVFEQVGASAKRMADAVKGASEQAEKSSKQFNEELKGSKNEMRGLSDPAVPAAKTFDKATSSMIRQVQRLNAELEAGGARNAAYFEKMASVKGADMSALAPYLADLKKAEAAQRVATTGLDQMGMSAKQTAAALRQIPMQFTDIVVSLQGGQSAMQVFLQQGGQLKDMFGGAGNAVRAMGGYVAGLVNPFTLAAAAIATIAVAYKQGSAEADGYRMALVTTGNAAGTTAAQMQQMAGRISSVVGTQGAAAEALAQMASSGRVASQNLEYFSEVAIKFERTTGTAISETVKRFAELGASPVDASRKLNEETNYLTASIYEQIKALKDQGRDADAAALAQNTYADALNNRSAQITQNLGAIEGAWKAIKDAAKSGWDAMLNVGRADSLGTQIDNVRQKIDQAKGLDPNRRHSMPWDTSLADLEKQLSYLTEQERMIRRGAEAQAQRTQAEKDAIAAADALQKTQNSGLTNQQKMNKALEEYARHIEKLKATNPTSVLLSPDAIERGKNAIRDQFSDKGKGKGSAGINAANKELAEQAKLIAELSGLTGSFAKDWDTLSAVYAKGGMSLEQLTSAQAALLAKQPAIKAFADEQAKAQQALAKANLDAAASREKYLTSLSTGLDKIRAEIAAQEEATARMGLSKEAIADLDAAKLEMLATDLELQAIKAMDRNLDEQTYDALKQQAQAYRDLAKAKQAGAAKEAALEMEKANAEAAKKAPDVWQKAADQINQSLTDALMRGFESGKDFAKNLRDTVVNMFKTMVLSPISGAFGMTGAANAATGGAGGADILSTVQTGFSALNGSISSTIGNAFSKFAGSSVGQSLGLSNPGAIMGNNPSAFVPAGGQLTPLGQSIGTGLGMLGNALAGYGISSAISNGYTTGGNTVNVIAGVASAFLGPIAGIVGGLINRAFGRKLKDSGIEGTLGGAAGFEGSAYDFYKGGWLRSDKTKYKDLDPTVSKGLSDAFKSIQAQVGTFATALGLETDKIASFTTSLKVSTKGLDEAGIQKALQDALATGSNELAKQVLGSWQTVTREITEQVSTGLHWDSGDQWETATRTIEETSYAASEFARDGEKAIDTLTRLATSITTVNGVFDRLGLTLYESSLAGADMASKLADSFGGLENLTAAVGVYYDNFYSEEEKRANVIKGITKTLRDAGAQITETDIGNATREQFRAMYESIVEVNGAADPVAVAMLNVAGAFAGVTESAKSSAEALEKSNAIERREFVKARREMQEAQQKAERDAMEAAKTAAADLFKSIQDHIKGIDDWLKGTLLDTNSLLSPEGKVQEAQAQFDALYASAAGGDAQAMGMLTEAASTLRDVARDAYASSGTYGAIEMDLRARLAALEAGAFDPNRPAPQSVESWAGSGNGNGGPTIAEVMAATGLSFQAAAGLTSYRNASGQYAAGLADLSGGITVEALRRAARELAVGASGAQWSTWTGDDGIERLRLALADGTFAQTDAGNARGAYDMAFRLGLTDAEARAGLALTGDGQKADGQWWVNNWNEQSAAIGNWVKTSGQGQDTMTHLYQIQADASRASQEQVEAVRASGSANAQGLVEQTQVLQSIDRRLANMESSNRMGAIA